MYDPKQELHEFVGEDREAALAKARAFFGLGPDALEVFELPPGEVYGLGGRVVLVAGARDRRPPVRSERGGGGGERGGRDRDRGGRERGGRDRDRGGRDRGGRDRGERERGGYDAGRGREPRERSEPRETAAPERSDEPSVGTVEGELGEIGRFVCGVVERLEIGPFTIQESSDEGITAIEIRGSAAKTLAAGEGRTADALQLLANQALARTDEEGSGRVVLEIEGEGESREGHLERLAERVVKRALEGGRAIALDPMNGRDRRTVHISVRGYDGVATMSIGEGRYRQVVVVPQGAPEYEEAVRQSQAPDRSS